MTKEKEDSGFTHDDLEDFWPENQAKQTKLDEKFFAKHDPEFLKMMKEVQAKNGADKKTT